MNASCTCFKVPLVSAAAATWLAMDGIATGYIQGQHAATGSDELIPDEREVLTPAVS